MVNVVFCAINVETLIEVEQVKFECMLIRMSSGGVHKCKQKFAK